ncbi:Fip1 motif-domain-containing protein [Hyaloraphidium curvatum]|nr:Fip1 motif-domain-containing protein [Hyaloraphidium curvatum]
MYEGQPIIDIDPDLLDDKPWRRPGADLSDYFNYGFNEDTWRAYCLKQKQLMEQIAQKKVCSGNLSVRRGETEVLLLSSTSLADPAMKTIRTECRPGRGSTWTRITRCTKGTPLRCTRRIWGTRTATGARRRRTDSDPRALGCRILPTWTGCRRRT